jgi:D-arginine dehydrogenase
VEAEDQLAHHTTGRSAAVFSETYGSPEIRALTVASRATFEDPGPEFEVELLAPRGALWIAGPDEVDAAREEAARAGALVPSVQLLDAPDAHARCPALRTDAVAAGVLEPDAADIDVHALLSGYRRRASAAGATVVTGARVLAADRVGGTWHVQTSAGPIEAALVIDAAGAWADEVARAFGVGPVGLQPLRRTAFLFEIPGMPADPAWPLVITLAHEGFYFKPESGRLLGSLADETPSPPCDARPEEIDVALALDRIGTAVGVEITHARQPWAGLRTFSPDRNPVVGRDPRVDGFVWLAGQGGYGIQTAPAMARLAASAALGTASDRDVSLTVVRALGPDRYAQSASSNSS